MRKVIISVLSLLVLVANLVMPSPVYAATQDRTVTGVGSDTSNGAYWKTACWSGGVAGVDWTNIQSNDNCTTYLVRDAIAEVYRSYTVQAFSTANNGITNVTLTMTGYHPDLNIYSQAYVEIGGARYFATTTMCDGTGCGWTTYTFDDFGAGSGKNPATGVAWTMADMNGTYADWGVYMTGSSGKVQNGMSYLKITVSYNPIVAPTTTSSAATGVGYSGGLHRATLNGAVTNDGGATIDYYGFVWKTTTDGGDPGNVDPSTNPGTWTGWKSAVGDYGENSFSHEVTGLVQNSKYYFRAASHNSVGWSYSAAQIFYTLANPTVTTVAASSVGSTTARVNANVTYDGRDTTCTVEWIYTGVAGAYANYAAISAVAHTHVNAAGTWSTGGLPYYDLSSLTVSTVYTFCASITNDVSTAYGTPLTFTTASGVYAPTGFKGIPTSTTLSLQWVKGVGSNKTLVRYKLSSLPTSMTDGTQAYFDTMTSVVVTGLTPGTTYYIRVWGESGGTYSSTNATLLLTTLAMVAGGDPLPPVTTPDFWFQSPDYTTIAAFPLYATLNWGADCFGMPRGTFWFLLAIGLSIMGGVIAYSMSTNLLMSILATAFLLIIGVFAKLVPMWLLLPYFILAFTGMLVGERR